jgi:hypothetical protein
MKYIHSLVADTILGEPKYFQVEEDKILAKDPSSTIY